MIYMFSITRMRIISSSPPELKFSLPKKDTDEFMDKKKRAVVDYISGMMDTFAIKEWETHCKK